MVAMAAHDRMRRQRAALLTTVFSEGSTEAAASGAIPAASSSAKALGLTVPDKLLVAADEVIE
jgi:hypothetical protein